MIRSVIWRDDQRRISKFSVRGHAGAADRGYDIVCAAVSILVTNAINSSEHLLGVVIATDDEIASGDVVCEVPALSGVENERLQLLMESMVYGIRQVSEAYPDFVKFTEKSR
ncbi:hypothetical protein CIG75_08120 [Tumebacillus algifaecis]|uniref:Ribosomal processing cysteine protease Prp n=1 Tax=Tumebacillus algifaecis TaxID=1214604 RepID=A0A223D0L2_9BACL|nr:ribosomal-processing cysteine protease Prp [Tumebacillus algifaecis]ASS74953.1 hypothetical protein CIG75_08120 [Tumebacillus algifaecis]